jgi:hypothetical protein
MSPPESLLARAVLCLHGEFEAGTAAAIARMLAALGAQVREELDRETTHLVLGARSRSLAALLGKPAIERRAEALRTAGQSLQIWSEAELAHAVTLVAGTKGLPDALALAEDGQLKPRASVPPPPPRASVEQEALLASVREGSLAARLDAIELLGCRGDATVVPALIAAAEGARYEVLTAVTRALIRLGGEAAWPFLAARMADARLVDRSLRTLLARTLEARGDGEALAALAHALETLEGMHGLEEAAAFGRLAARGVTRWGTAEAPLALEFEAREETPSDLEALARRVGELERLVDERGMGVYRVRVARLPPLPVEGALANAAPFYALLALVGARRGSRMWLAGLSLPASLPWPVWLAIAAPLAGSASSRMNEWSR